MRSAQLPGACTSARAQVWILLACLVVPAAIQAQPSVVDLGDLGDVSVYAPSGPAGTVVLFVSGDGGWETRVDLMASRLRDAGALVVGIDIRALLARLEVAEGCGDPAMELSRTWEAVRGRLGEAEGRRPLLAGYSSGATLVYAALVADPGSYGGAISVGFCPDFQLYNALCARGQLSFTPKKHDVGYDLAAAPRVPAPWVVIQGEVDRDCPVDITRRFVGRVAGARIVTLPRVGHGFANTRRWSQPLADALGAVRAGAMTRTPPQGQR